MTDYTPLWDAKSMRDFDDGDCALVKLVEELDRDWFAEGRIDPRDCIARLERIKSTANFMLSAAKWAR